MGSTSGTRRFSDIATLVLGLGALSLAWLAWRKVHTPNDRLPVATAVPEWAELVRIATWPASERPGTAPHTTIVFIEPNCRACDVLLGAIDSIERLNHVSSSLGYIYLVRPATPADVVNAFVTAECVNEQGHLGEYIRGLVDASNAKAYASASEQLLPLDLPRLDKCRASAETRSIIERQAMAVGQLGIKQSPAILLDGFLLQPPFSIRSVDSAWSAILRRAD
jgi:hypothetical protein